MADLDEIRLEQAKKIEEETLWDCHEHDNLSDKQHIEECLSEMLAEYIGDERNYVVDGAEIECTEMCKVAHCIRYEKGKTKLYNVLNAPKGIERDYMLSGKEYGKTYYFGGDTDTHKVRRLFALHAKEASDNGIRFGTVVDRKCLRDVREGVAQAVIPDDGIPAACEANIISCGNCRIMRESDIAEIEKRWDESIEYGTCYSLIKPVAEWLNPLCAESVTGKCDAESNFALNTGLIEVGPTKPSCVITEHHKVLEFDTQNGKKEGLTMLSTLLCTRGGVITIKVHGQIYLDGNDLQSLEQRIAEKMNMISGKAINTLKEMEGLDTIDILARMIFQESHTYKNGEQNAIANSIINRLFFEKNYAGKNCDQTLKNLLIAEKQYQSIREYSAAYHPPQMENDLEYDGWENAKRLAATVMVALEDSMPDSDHNGDIGTVIMIDKDVSKEEVFSIIESQNDSCGNNIDNPIGDRLSFYAVGGDYKAKEGEIIIYTDGDRDRGGHVFHYG